MRRRRNHRAKPFLGVHFVLSISVVTLLIYFYGQATYFDWKNIRPEIRGFVKAMDELEYGAVGGAHHTLIKNATEAELEILEDYPSPSVRTAAYIGLMRKDTSRVFELACEAFQDVESMWLVTTGSCVITTTCLAEYIYEDVLCLSDDMPPCSLKNLGEYLTSVQKEELKRLYDQTLLKSQANSSLAVKN